MLISNSGNDFSTSVFNALDYIDGDWHDLNGVLVVGTHVPENVDEKIALIQKAREEKIPFLGICFGMQLAVIEYARNVLKLDANSLEIDPYTFEPVVVKLPELRVGLKLVNGREESHWHNYYVNPDYHKALSRAWSLTLTDNIVEEMRLSNHPFFMGVQYHPEYQSSKDRHHPVLKEFIKACSIAEPRQV
jgi:CTP synthase